MRVCDGEGPMVLDSFLQMPGKGRQAQSVQFLVIDHPFSPIMNVKDLAS